MICSNMPALLYGVTAGTFLSVTLLLYYFSFSRIFLYGINMPSVILLPIFA